MSTTKIVVIVIVVCVVLFILLIIYSLSPTTRNVSNEPVFSPFINKSIPITRTGYVYKCDKGMYDLVENILTDRSEYYGARILELQPGSFITIRSFKTYRNNLGSGFTHLYAIGEVSDKNGSTISFEYSLGTVDKDLYSDDGPTLLTLTIWQNPGDKNIELWKK